MRVNYCVSMERILPQELELLASRVQLCRTSISDRVSISTFGSTVIFRWYLLGGDTVAPSGLYARLWHAFSSFYLFSFFYLSFLMISRRQIISRSAEPIFAIFTSNESFLGVDDRSGPLFSISQGTLPWQPILCKNGAKLPTPCTYRSGIQKRYGITPCMCKIK